MTVRERIVLCRLLGKIDKHRDFSKGIGIENISRFKGKGTQRKAEINKKINRLYIITL